MLFAFDEPWPVGTCDTCDNWQLQSWKQCQICSKNGKSGGQLGHTQMSVWDHSWLTPRLVCGFRFMRIPPKSGLDGGSVSTVASTWTGGRSAFEQYRCEWLRLGEGI